jgi:hypothetical protein
VAGRRQRQYIPYSTVGVLASWAADEYSLGHTAKVERTLRDALRQGWLGAPAAGRAYIRHLKRFLRSTGYLRG